MLLAFNFGGHYRSHVRFRSELERKTKLGDGLKIMSFICRVKGVVFSRHNFWFSNMSNENASVGALFVMRASSEFKTNI